MFVFSVQWMPFDWIRTADLWYWKRPIYPLSRWTNPHFKRFREHFSRKGMANPFNKKLGIFEFLMLQKRPSFTTYGAAMHNDESWAVKNLIGPRNITKCTATSVTRLGYFCNVLETNFWKNLAKIFGNFLGNLKSVFS